MPNLDIAVFNTGFETKIDEAVLCQVGAALALVWDRVSPAAQGEILTLVEIIEGVPKTPSAAARFLNLVECNAQRS